MDGKKHWSLEGELGVAYTGSPKVSLTSPNHDQSNDNPFNPYILNDDLAAESKRIQKDADKYKFYPIIKIGLSYSF